jgi:hypothetical protein
MKNFYTLLLFLFATVSTFAQAPEKMSYQAVLRDGTNTLLTNQEVGMQISILQTSITGTSVYLETQTPTTNINGLVSIEIGTGMSSDDFSAIDWSAGPYFIKTATDPTGGTSYTITGTSQLMSVPFAMYAKTSGSSTLGPQGPTGAAGASGVTGADGANGEKGATGDQGAQGIQGETGSAGVDGTNGDNGDQGIQGIQGTAGTDGDTGVAGDQGTQGIQGETGATGADGVIGAAGTNGSNGAQGIQGATGAAGAAGADGANGATGADGANGEEGATGDQGTQGIQGETGATGADGAQGAAGTNGSNGAQGTQGIAGTNGGIGATGDQGAAGLTTAVNAIAQIGGNITITTTDIPEGDNKYYTDALVSVNTTVIANTDKVGITAQQSDAITTNTDKVGYTEALVSANADVVLNKSKVGQAAGTTTGDMQYWNGTTWVVVAAGAAGQELTMNSGATAPEWVTPNSTLPTLAIGQVYQGGIIFYLDASGKHGLIAAPSDQSTGIQWYNGAYTNTTAFASCVGCGDGNTSRIVYSNGSGSYATKLCYDLNSGGNTDWYLPSKYELNLMYQNIGKGNALGLGNIGNFANNYYWSSTENDFNGAWNQNFVNGNQDYTNKIYTYNVRALRAF